MQWLTKKTIVQTYLIVVLLIGMVVSPLPQLLLAAVLLTLQLYTIYRPPAAKVNVILLLGTLTLMPLTLILLTGSLLSALFSIPAIYLLDAILKANAHTQFMQPQKSSRQATIILKAATAALTAILVLSLTTLSWATVTTTAILIIYFTGATSFSLYRIPKQPFKKTKTSSSILAGETERKKLTLSAETIPIYIHILHLEPWVKVLPATVYVEAKKQATIDIVYTPPLAGPSKIQLQATVLDPRGLLQTNQILEPVKLHIIPKAKYAQWLAKKILDQKASGISITASEIPFRTSRTIKIGLEYRGNQLYQPGDRIKDVDWKHTLMLNELIVKKFTGTQSLPVIIMADLTADNAQEADKLAYNIVIAALTAMLESVQTGLASYGYKGVIIATAPINPRETLKKALSLIKQITIMEPPVKVIEPAETYSFRIGKASGTAEGLLRLLEFENSTIEMLSKESPSYQALGEYLLKKNRQATIILTSQLKDNEIIRNVNKIKSRGSRIIAFTD